MKYLLFLILLMTNCATKTEYDPILEKHVQEFKKYCLETYYKTCGWPHNLIVTFTTNLSEKFNRENIHANCYIDSITSQRIVEVDTDYYWSSQDWKQEQLVFHELGHCVKELPHQYGLSIMHPNLQLESDQYYSLREKLIHQLFTGSFPE